MEAGAPSTADNAATSTSRPFISASSPGRLPPAAAGGGARVERSAPDPVEDAVHEWARGGRRELLRDLDRLVDHDGMRRFGLEEKLVEPQAKEVSVDGGHPSEAPVLRLLQKLRVELLAMLEPPAHEAGGILLHLPARLPALAPPPLP